REASAGLVEEAAADGRPAPVVGCRAGVVSGLVAGAAADGAEVVRDAVRAGDADGAAAVAGGAAAPGDGGADDPRRDGVEREAAEEVGSGPVPEHGRAERLEPQGALAVDAQLEGLGVGRAEELGGGVSARVASEQPGGGHGIGGEGGGGDGAGGEL